MKHKRPWIAKVILSKIKCWRHYNTQLQTILRSHTIKTVWYWHKNRQEGQCIRIEDPDINTCIYSKIIFEKGAETQD
jgi:hypothetical protein